MDDSLQPNIFLVAEVMDKEPTLVSIWLASAIISAAGFALVRYRRHLVILAFVFATVFALLIIPELHDRFVGAAIRIEAGASYIIQAYAATIFAFVIPALGLVDRRKRLSPN